MDQPDLNALSQDQLRQLARELRRRLRHAAGDVDEPDTVREAIARLTAVIRGEADDIHGVLRQIAANSAMYGGVATDPYEEIVHRLHLCKDTFDTWRTHFADNSRAFAKDIAKAFNKYRSLGHLKAPEVDPDAIETALGQPHAPFNRESFDRFTGPALGDLRIYRPHAGDSGVDEVAAPPVHSIWGMTREDGGKYIQRITGSNRDYVRPESLPDVFKGLAAVELDLTLNGYTPELGMVSWVSFYQNHSNQMRSIGYELGDRLLWVNQLLQPDMTPTVGPMHVGGLPGDPVIIRENQLVLSLDWATEENDQRWFNVYAMHIDFDFDRGRAQFAGPILKMVNEVVEL